MTDRITRQQLESMIDVLNQEIPGQDFSIGGAYGGYKIERKNGSVDVSEFGYGTKRECYTYLSAMIKGAKFYRDSFVVI